MVCSYVNVHGGVTIECQLDVHGLSSLLKLYLISMGYAATGGHVWCAWPVLLSEAMLITMTCVAA